jgi:hypothetical protein
VTGVQTCALPIYWVSPSRQFSFGILSVDQYGCSIIICILDESIRIARPTPSVTVFARPTHRDH